VAGFEVIGDISYKMDGIAIGLKACFVKKS
jgi:hypothetical protein